MKKETPASDVPESTQQHNDQPAEQPAAGISTETLKQFGDAFGDKAMEYLQAGLTFDAATVAHKDHEIAQLKEQVKQLSDQQENQEQAETSAAATLKQFGDNFLGEQEPVGTDGGDAGGGNGKTQFADFFKTSN